MSTDIPVPGNPACPQREEKQSKTFDEIVQSAAGGDKAAENILFDTLISKRVLAWGRYRLHLRGIPLFEADDLFAEAILRLIRKIRTDRYPDNLMAYLITILNNLASEYF